MSCSRCTCDPYRLNRTYWVNLAERLLTEKVAIKDIVNHLANYLESAYDKGYEEAMRRQQ